VNKAELIEALSARLGDKKSANAALDAVLAEIQAAVTKGDKVAITGFGVLREAHPRCENRPQPAHRRSGEGEEDVGARVPRRRWLP
jgi:DNA-binding protein HU-beta